MDQDVPSDDGGVCFEFACSCQWQTMKGNCILLRHVLLTALTPSVHAWEHSLQGIPRLPGHCDGMIESFTTVASTISMPLDLIIPIPFMSAGYYRPDDHKQIYPGQGIFRG